MADKPVTREEKYLAYLTGDYTGELPKPITRKEKYLYELCLKGIGGEISPEEIKNAVNAYLAENPVKPGATTEQAQQIEQNKTDVASLGTILREKKPSYYKTVSEMQSDILLSKGMVAVTLGYYNASDGGGATYIINESETNSSKINIKLNNGLYANIIILDKIVNVLTAGIKK